MSDSSENKRKDYVTKYVEILSKITDASEDFQEAAMLFGISTVLGRNWVFNSLPDKSVFKQESASKGKLLNLWFIILGKSRVSRKTSGVQKHIQDLLDAVMGNTFALTKLFTPEYLIKEMAAKTKESSGIKVTHCYWMKDEVAGFFKLVKKRESYMADIDDVLSSIYDGTTTTRGTIGREKETVENPYLTCFHASTDFLPTFFDELQIRLGFLNRFIFVMGKRQDRMELRTQELVETEKQSILEIKEFLKELFAKKTLTTMEMSNEAKQKYDLFEKEMENKIETEDLEIKEGYCGQLPNLVVRLSCIYRISRMSIEEVKNHWTPTLVVEKQDVERAILYAMKAWGWFEQVIEIMKASDKQKKAVFPKTLAKEAIINFLKDGSEKNSNKIVECAIQAGGGKQATVYNALKELEEEAKIEKARQGYYRLKLPKTNTAVDSQNNTQNSWGSS
jgi:hypothetical protein